MPTKMKVLFVQNHPERGITAIEAFCPDPEASTMSVARELEALKYISPDLKADLPDLVVLDIELPKKVEKSIRKSLEHGRLTHCIPIVRLEAIK